MSGPGSTLPSTPRRRLRCAIVVAAVVALPAIGRADTVNAIFQYTHHNTDGSETVRPARNMHVDVWQYDPPPGFPHIVVSGSTDANGKFVDSNVPSGAACGIGINGKIIRIFAWNWAARVNRKDLPVDFTYDTSWQWHGCSSTFDWGTITFSAADSEELNVADVIARGREYAEAHRDPTETDSANIPQIGVDTFHLDFPIAPTFYDPVLNRLHLAHNFLMDDRTVLHEYSHYLEHEISQFAPIASDHDGCHVTWAASYNPLTLGFPWGPQLDSAEHAWMEGFADFLSAAIVRSACAALGSPCPVLDGPANGTLAGHPLENPGGCDVLGTTNNQGQVITADMLEQRVAATLWDLVDDCRFGEPNCDSEPDLIGNKDTEIFHIFDNELDHASALPTLLMFHRAWASRGLDDVGFDQVANFNGISQGTLHDAHHQIAKQVSTAAARNPSGGVSVGHRGTNDALFVMEQNGAHGAFGDWISHGGDLAAAPVLTYNPTTNTLWVAARMTNGTVAAIARTPNGWTGWMSLLMPLTTPANTFAFNEPRPLRAATSVAMAVDDLGRMHVFVIGNERVWERDQLTTDATQSSFRAGWQALPSLHPSSSLSALTNGGNITLFALEDGTDQIMTTRGMLTTAGLPWTWPAWTPLGGTATSAPTSATNGWVDRVVVRGTDWRAFVDYRFFFTDFLGWTQPDAVPPIVDSAVAVTADNLFATSTDGLHLMVRAGIASADPSAWSQIATPVRMFSPPVAAVDASGSAVVFMEGMGRRLWATTYPPSPTTVWTPLNGEMRGFAD
jgi:hypothetical protein